MKTGNRGVLITAFVLIFIFAAACISAFFVLKDSGGDKKALVYSNGKLIREINLDEVNESYSFRVESENGGYNIINVENGKIYVSEASCPDKVCIRTGKISSSAVPIACLPNKLVIEIKDKYGKTDLVV